MKGEFTEFQNNFNPSKTSSFKIYTAKAKKKKGNDRK